MKKQKIKKREYQYFVNENGELVMRPERFKDTKVLLKCRLSLKENDNHTEGVYLY